MHEVHYMSTLLHPSLKRFQIAPDEKQKAIDLVKSEMLKRQSCSSDGPSDINITYCSSTKSKQQQPLSTTQNLLSQCFDLPIEDQDSVSASPFDKELVDYMALNVTLKPNDDVLLFWKNYEKFFPILASIVASIYSIPASNTTVERLFSQANNTLSPRRTNIQTEKVNKLLFLNKNLLPLKELDQQQLKHMHEKRKLAQMSMSASSSTANNNDIDHEPEQSFSSSTTKKSRVADEDEYSDHEFIDKHCDSIDEISGQE